ncbi:MAG TPA: glycosyltransferase family 2 protein [Candidatus Saccharimonadales bacterium]|nr:glycosyltransferase family 2 protein [Candidatus Saccharimonadales bacterium]
MKKLCIIVPAYNEDTTISKVVVDLIKVFKNSRFNDFQVVVVDDGSKDDTSAKAAKAGAYVISHILNMGTGSATATGLSYAQQNGYTLAATLDADGQHDPKDVLSGIELMEKGYDLLIGSRLIDNQGMSKVKILGNKGLSYITYILFGINVTDSQSGLRVFSQRALNELTWKTSGYEFCSEMLWRAKQLGLNINEFPIHVIYTDYSKQKGQNNWNAFNIVKVLLKRRIVELFSE